MTTFTVPAAGRYRIVSIDTEGRQDRSIGRRFVSFDGQLAEAHDRRPTGPVIRSLLVVSATRTANKVWELVGDSGETWRLTAGCNCGGG